MENMIVINNRQYMGIDEAAKSLGVSVHHVRREMYRNNIRYFRHAKKSFSFPVTLYGRARTSRRADAYEA